MMEKCEYIIFLVRRLISSINEKKIHKNLWGILGLIGGLRIAYEIIMKFLALLGNISMWLRTLIYSNKKFQVALNNKCIVPLKGKGIWQKVDWYVSFWKLFSKLQEDRVKKASSLTVMSQIGVINFNFMSPLLMCYNKIQLTLLFNFSRFPNKEV